MKTETTKLSVVIGMIVSSLCAFLLFGGIWTTFRWFHSLSDELDATLITAFTTISVATLTLAVGRYFERIKETEAHFRPTKVEMYDEFLKEFFSLFGGDEKLDFTKRNLVPFLKEWQRQLVLWGGEDVVVAYIKWKQHLSNPPDANTIFLMEDFFRAMRKDLGLSSKKISRGLFSHMILRHADLFLAVAKQNPRITLSELAEIEKKSGLEA